MASERSSNQEKEKLKILAFYVSDQKPYLLMSYLLKKYNKVNKFIITLRHFQEKQKEKEKQNQNQNKQADLRTFP